MYTGGVEVVGVGFLWGLGQCFVDVGVGLGVEFNKGLVFFPP